MVGGIVIGLSRTKDRTHVRVAECPHGRKHDPATECPYPDTLSVYTDEVRLDNQEKVTINLGDSLWWQSGKCYWTPRAIKTRIKSGKDYDIPMVKIGYSH